MINSTRSTKLNSVSSIFGVLAVTWLFSTSLHAENESSNSNTADKELNSTRTFIPYPLEVPTFTPPAPPVEKEIPAMRVFAAVTVPTKNSKTLTILRSEASTLPDLPAPPVSEPQQARELTVEEMEQAKTWRRYQLNLGATIYDHRTSQVRWQHPDTGESYEALCGFDVGLLAGIGGFMHQDKSYALFLMHSDFDTSEIRSSSEKSQPDFPEAPEDSITVIKGNPDDPVGTAPITMVKELIVSEKNRLVAYQAARLKYQQAAAEWEKTHPVIPRDETFWFKPHRGSRYLVNPKPEASTK